MSFYCTICGEVKGLEDAQKQLTAAKAEVARLKAELNAWVKGDRWLDNGDVMATTPLGALEAPDE
jgi:hypothetical protein